MSGPPAIDARGVIADLRELERRTADERGAQRLCWSETWRAARVFLGELLAEIGIEPETDEAGNLWARLDGAEPGAPALALGSHLDSVPDGGWLDGALGVMAALAVLRAHAAVDSPPPRGLVLVDWADEEGARFGRSLFGSSAFAGTLDPAELGELRDAEDRPIAEVLAANGVELERAGECARRREGLGAYLELHIEQGPR
ncbi:MAG: M20/M25/M40 family metallo-hydrolase, partial [Solirubrobacterales bacterium]